jgi:hypothetical protein
MKKEQTSNLAAMRDRIPVKPQGQQLSPGHDSMLPSRQPGEQTVGCGQLGGTIALK